MNLEMEQPRPRLNRDKVFAMGQTPIPEILRKTADAVPAHLSLRTVRIVHPHRKRSRLAGQNRDDTIAPNPELAVAEGCRL